MSIAIALLPLTGLPEVEAGADLGALVAAAWLRDAGVPVETDVLVVAQKIVSKAEGCLQRIADVEPSPVAAAWAATHAKDARLVEIVLRESRRIVRMDRGVLIVETRHGFVCANAGVDTSNVPPGYALTLPEDPDGSATRLRARVAEITGVEVGVIVADTFGRPWRDGLTNVAIGLAGVAPLEDHRGSHDAFGRRLQVSVIAVADEIAAAAELVMGKTRRIPAAVVRGLDYRAAGATARPLIRPHEDDLFR